MNRQRQPEQEQPDSSTMEKVAGVANMGLTAAIAAPYLKAGYAKAKGWMNLKGDAAEEAVNKAAQAVLDSAAKKGQGVEAAMKAVDQTVAAGQLTEKDGALLKGAVVRQAKFMEGPLAQEAAQIEARTPAGGAKAPPPTKTPKPTKPTAKATAKAPAKAAPKTIKTLVPAPKKAPRVVPPPRSAKIAAKAALSGPALNAPGGTVVQGSGLGAMPGAEEMAASGLPAPAPTPAPASAPSPTPTGLPAEAAAVAGAGAPAAGTAAKGIRGLLAKMKGGISKAGLGGWKGAIGLAAILFMADRIFGQIRDAETQKQVAGAGIRAQEAGMRSQGAGLPTREDFVTQALLGDAQALEQAQLVGMYPGFAPDPNAQAAAQQQAQQQQMNEMRMSLMRQQLAQGEQMLQ